MRNGAVSRVTVIIVTCVILGPVLGGFAKYVSAATTIYVPDNYASIQAAVDAADPGNTIIVRDGTYMENVDVNKDHVTIRSENGAPATLVQPANLAGAVFLVTGDNVTIEGLTIRGGDTTTGTGVNLFDADYCNISNNHISNSGGDGILSHDSENVTVINNMIEGNKDRGIEAWRLTDSVITSNTVKLNGFMGIHLIHSSGNQVTRNDVVANKRSGIFLPYSSNNLFCLNNFMDNDTDVSSRDSTNIWHSPQETTYTYNDKTYTGYLGNYWSDYSGDDADRDGIGDIPYDIDGEQDSYPLMEPFENYEVFAAETTEDIGEATETEFETSQMVGTLEIIAPPDGFALEGTFDITFKITNTGSEQIVFLKGDASNRVDLEFQRYSEDTIQGTILWSTTQQGLTMAPGERFTETVQCKPGIFEGRSAIWLVHWERYEHGYEVGSLGKSEINGVLVAQATDTTIIFPDPNLEVAIRQAISKPTGDIYGSELATLTALKASNDSIANLTGLEYCTNLTTLDLGYNQISSLSPLAGLTNLEKLYLFGNQISNISPLAGLTNLQSLYLGDPDRVKMTRMESLHLDAPDFPGGNQISDISPLAGLINLRNLGLSVNRINDISPLAGLTNLRNLFLEKNQVSDISPLAGMTNLRWLDLWNNQVTDISPLAGLTNLRSLNLASNNVRNISPLSNLAELQVLYLDDNEISDLAPLSGLTQLGEIYEGYQDSRERKRICLGLRNNKIDDIKSLVENAGLSQGDGLDIRGNPLSEISHDKHVPQLQRRGVEVLYDARGEVESEPAEEPGPTPAPALTTTIEVASSKTIDLWYELTQLRTVIERVLGVKRAQLHGNSSRERSIVSQTYSLLAQIKPSHQEVDLVTHDKDTEAFLFGLKQLTSTIVQEAVKAGIMPPWSWPATVLMSEGADELGRIIAKKLELRDLSYVRVTTPSVGTMDIFYHKDQNEVWVYVELEEPAAKMEMYIPVKATPDWVSAFRVGMAFALEGMQWKLSSVVDDAVVVELKSPGELRVYDSQGRVTGLVNGRIEEGIPNSSYYADFLVILSPSDSYDYEVAGTDKGSYSLTVSTVTEQMTNSFTATNIPTVSGAVHRYSIDWDALPQGEDGVTVKMDSDGDGKFERTVSADTKFDEKDYVSSLQGPNWQLVIGIVVGIIIVVGGIYLVTRFL